MKIRTIAFCLILSAALLMLSGCGGLPEAQTFGGESYRLFSDFSGNYGLSFYYPAGMTVLEEEGCLLSAEGNGCRLQLRRIDTAASVSSIDGAAQLERACAQTIAQLAADSGIDAQYVSASEKSFRQESCGSCDALVLSYTITAEVPGYGLSAASSSEQIIIFGEHCTYILSLYNDSGSAAERFSALISSIDCR